MAVHILHDKHGGMEITVLHRQRIGLSGLFLTTATLAA